MISIIVPSYNIEEYLERCVESLVNQTYKDIEIILVDDGSTDGTGILCDKLANTDSRIYVIHKENGGLSDARNAGIEVAKGEFYSFIDGDDYIEPDAYESMIAEMINPKVSIVVGGLVVTDIDGVVGARISPTVQCLTREEAFMDLFVGSNYILQSSCNKLFRSSLFKEIRYKKNIVNEDMEILPRLLDVADNVVILDKAMYHYVKKSGSITSSPYSKKRFEAIEIERNIYEMCREKYPQLAPYASIYELKSLYGMLYNLLTSSNREKFKVEELKIRVRIVKVYFRCIKWPEVRTKYGREISTYLLYTLLGVNNVNRLLKIKQFLCGEC